ncbi:hypothetical protein SAMN05444141_109129 [Pseudovibrio denitrificans]|uniref:Alpha/beta hydrolase family protein n=1 Tax=Pseudovibrio denitrificans TaxID=258256 RepID=A0A1I7DLN3_9HYPH|nr:alpha/beta hydrolase [Pseudovibrio denitrificans]SFU12608.1 hypothetical protein SAMN05444141_109129 [Pseudovibrio denitrificans]
MKISEADILIVPGLHGSDANHWQSRWQAKFSTGRRIEQKDWSKPDLEEWVNNVVKAVEEATRPVVLVAHSAGVATVVHAAPRIKNWVKGAYLVAPADVDDSSCVPTELHGFAPFPTSPLPFHAKVVASRNDPYCTYERAEQLAKLWNARLQDAGESGHINSESGQGPWPEGIISFAHFMKELG